MHSDGRGREDVKQESTVLIAIDSVVIMPARPRAWREFNGAEMKNRKHIAGAGSITDRTKQKSEIGHGRRFDVERLEQRVLLDGNMFISDATPPDTATPNAMAGAIGEYTTAGTACGGSVGLGVD